jgi:hypothetical protein
VPRRARTVPHREVTPKPPPSHTKMLAAQRAAAVPVGNNWFLVTGIVFCLHLIVLHQRAQPVPVFLCSSLMFVSACTMFCRFRESIYGYAWMSIDFFGYPWISIDLSGYPWISMNISRYPWISLEIHGYQRVSMDFHRYPWTPMDIYGYLCLRGNPWISIESEVST